MFVPVGRQFMQKYHLADQSLFLRNLIDDLHAAIAETEYRLETCLPVYRDYYRKLANDLHITVVQAIKLKNCILEVEDK